MIAVIMTYFNRPQQLQRTLRSLIGSCAEFEVIVVDDDSGDDVRLPDDVPYKITLLRTVNKTWTNPEPAYNFGIHEALRCKADIIVLQNAECFHVGDVLNYAERMVDDHNYISFGCYSIDKETTFGLDGDLIKEINPRAARYDGDNGWYNHPVYRPVGYDFCSAITADNLRRLNGYDERFSHGWGYGDDYLIARVRMLELKVHITEQPFVIHQWHYDVNGVFRFKNKTALVRRNKRLYEQLIQRKEARAKHLITRDL